MLRIFVFVFVFVLSAEAMADSTRLPGVIDRGVPEIELPSVSNVDLDAIAPEPDVRKVENGREILTVLKAVEFKDLTLLDEAVLQKVVDPYLNRNFRREDLAQLKYDLTKEFYDRGYILVGVATPPQDISDGILEVVVYETKVGKFSLENTVVAKALENALKDEVQEGEVFRENEAETMIADFNDLQSVKAKLDLRPGSEYATTDLNLLVQEADEDIQRVTVHNYGSELTGRHVAELHLEKGNLLTLGDTLSFDGSISEEGLWKVGGGFKTPIAVDNIYFHTSYYHSENDIGGNLAALNANGKSDVFDIHFSKKFINTRRNNLDIALGFEYRNHESTLSDVTDSDDKIRRVYTEGSYLKTTNSSVFFANLRISKGLDVLGASERGDLLATRLDGDPEAWIVKPTLVAHFSILENDVMKLSATGQMSSNPLLSSDMFAIGGYGSVRGFQPSEEVGDAGWQFTAEYLYDIPVAENWNVAFGPFFDGARVYNRIDNTAQDDTLYSTGLTLEASSRLFFEKNRKTKFKFDWAHPVGHYENPDLDEDTFYFRVVQEF